MDLNAMLRVTATLGFAAVLAALGIAHAADVPNAIYTMSTDGQSVRKLAQVDGYHDHAAPRWSRDGNFVAFDAIPIDGQARQCFAIAADGSHLLVIDGQAMPAWAPNEQRLAFQVSSKDGGEMIVAQNLDGQGRAEIVAGMAQAGRPMAGNWPMRIAKC